MSPPPPPNRGRSPTRRLGFARAADGSASGGPFDSGAIVEYRVIPYSDTESASAFGGPERPAPPLPVRNGERRRNG